MLYSLVDETPRNVNEILNFESLLKSNISIKKTISLIV